MKTKTRVTIAFECDEALAARLQERAAERGCTVATIVERTLRAYFAMKRLARKKQ